MHSLFRDEFFNRAFNMFDDWMSQTVGQPSTKLITESEHYCVQVVAPGYSEKELNVSVRDNFLTVSAQHKKCTQDRGIYSELNSFEQSWQLPTDAMTEHINAEHRDGVLNISIPRAKYEALEARQIPIKALTEGSK